MTIRTFRQYATTERNARRAEYGCTVAEAEEFWSDHYLRVEYVAWVLRLVRAGERPTPAVLRTWDDDLVYYIRKFGDAHDIVKLPPQPPRIFRRPGVTVVA